MAIAGIIVSGEGLDSSFGGWCFMILGQSQGVMAAGIILYVSGAGLERDGGD